jgi:pyruvate-formate lyase-activating enzyme
MNDPAEDDANDVRARQLERRWFQFADRVERYISPRLLPAVATLAARCGRWVPVPAIWRLRAILYGHSLTLPVEALGPVLVPFGRDIIRSAFAHDPWYANKLVNVWEFETGQTVLESYPCDVSIPIADLCNARCTFCTSWLEGSRMLDPKELEAFEPVIRHANVVGLAGHGEPLSHPKIPEILERLAEWLDKRARTYVITNGVFLDRYLDQMLRARVASYAISLNAATAATHRTVMGLEDGAFEAVLATIRRIVTIRHSQQAAFPVRISISLVLTKQNMHEVAGFVRLGNTLGVDEIQLKTLAGAQGAIVGLNYHDLPPYDHPDYAALKAEALSAIAASEVLVTADPESWDTRVFPPEIEALFAAAPPEMTPRAAALSDRAVRAYYATQEKFGGSGRGALIQAIDDRTGEGPYRRQARFACRAPYYFLYINDFSYNMSPCCYMGSVPGYQGVTYDGSGDFFAAWNSPAMVGLRARLRDGPLFRMCERCPGVY